METRGTSAVILLFMKISIITATYNCQATVAQALASVKDQSYDDIEHILIDGASTDGTLSVLEAYQAEDQSVILKSAADDGIYDALNKGLALATGDYIGILHADDFFASKTIIADVVNCLEAASADALYGDLYYVSSKNPEKVIRSWVSGDYDKRNLKKGWMPPHPTVFMRKSLYEKHGYFDLNYRIAADYELMMRYLSLHDIKPVYLPGVITHMRVGGVSNSPGNIWQKSKEDYRAMKCNKVGGILTLLNKNISKIPQFFKKT